VGGQQLSAELRSLSWTFKNNLAVETTPGAGTGYANRAFRTGREQSLKIDRDFRDFLMSQHLLDNDYLGLYLKAEGPEYEAGQHYQVELVFPRVAVQSAPVKAAPRRLGEDVELAVLEDATYGSVIAGVQNQVSGYAG
jgi:hypothetical protein